MADIIAHTTLGFCWWDIPALIVLVVVIVGFAVQRHKMKQEEEKLKKQG